MGPYDVQFHRTGAIVDRPIIRDFPGSTRPIFGAKGRLDYPVGGYACHFGQGGAQPEYKCGDIADRSYTPQSPRYNSPWNKFVLVVNYNADLSDPGDSGGPWFIGYDALGIHSGSSGYTTTHRAYYMSVTYLNDDGPQDLNLTVRKAN